MHAHRFALFVRTGQFEPQRDAGLIDVSVESGGVRERSDIEFVGYSTATSALSVIGLVMASALCKSLKTYGYRCEAG